MLDRRWTAGLYPREVSLLEDLQQTCIFTAVSPLNNSMLTPRIEVGKPRMFLYTWIWWFDYELAQDKGLELWQTLLYATKLKDSMRHDCLDKVVRRNRDVTDELVAIQMM